MGTQSVQFFSSSLLEELDEPLEELLDELDELLDELDELLDELEELLEELEELLEELEELLDELEELLEELEELLCIQSGTPTETLLLQAAKINVAPTKHINTSKNFFIFPLSLRLYSLIFS